MIDVLFEQRVSCVSCGDWDDVRTQMREAERAAILIYTHFRNEFGLPLQQSGRSAKGIKRSI